MEYKEPTVAKIITKPIDYITDAEHVGFQRNFGFCYAIFVLQQLVKKAMDYEIPLYLLFIDLEKTFDDVKQHGYGKHRLSN